MKIRLHELKENLVYLGLWLTLFLAPVVTMFFRPSSNTEMDFDWSEVFHVWKTYVIYLVIFLIHNFILAPLLIYKNKKTMYLLTTTCLVAVFIMFQCTQKPKHLPAHHHRMKMEKEFHRFNKDKDCRSHKEFHPKFREDKMRREHKEPLPPLMFGQADLAHSIMIILLLGMNLGIKLYFKSDQDAKEMQQLEKQNLEQQLEYLKCQINPHFFMNTLNNIHALVDINPEMAKSTILELSKLMRYVLYEGAKTLVPLQKDINFMRNYINLMKLRYTDKVKIDIDIPENIPDKSIPPMLLITFVENAFKHGVSYKDYSFITIKLTCTDERLYFSCQNSKHPESTNEQGGVGLANVKKRLELLFGDNHHLDIHDEDNTYMVNLEIPFLQSSVQTTSIS
ncbi:MAG: histidine kinase [Prevotella sp.]|nr:histidine kinase [Prevotella sp.]